MVKNDGFLSIPYFEFFFLTNMDADTFNMAFSKEHTQHMSGPVIRNVTNLQLNSVIFWRLKRKPHFALVC